MSNIIQLQPNFVAKPFQDKYVNTSSWSIKDHQFCPVQYSLQCHGELSSCLLYDLRKYRAHHSLLVRFQRNLVWRRHLSAIYNDGSIPSPIFLPPIIPNGTKITGCFSQCWEGKGEDIQASISNSGSCCRENFSFPCIFLCHGLYLVSAGSVIVNSVRKQSFCGLDSKMLPEFQADFLQPKLQDSLVWCLKVSPNYSIWNSLSSQAKGNKHSKWYILYWQLMLKESEDIF